MNACSARMQTRSEQDVIEKICTPDAFVQLQASHRLIERYFEAYFGLTRSVRSEMYHSENRQCIRAISDSLTIHFCVVTLYFHPVVTFVMDNPSEFASNSIIKYANFKVLVSELEQASSAAEQFEKITELKTLFQQHVEEEEAITFPKLQKSPLKFTDIGETIYLARERFETEFHGKAKRKARPYTTAVSRHQRPQASLYC